eukprot:GILJ01003892.1.p1 GENE.GILJ01003892.1~~GILJ01003892.1.p1  ORF type:complete len:588 (-),score=99.65 GILJ01003892.1:174-1937(-)
MANLVHTVQEYINKMLGEVPGMKILIMDVETTGIVSIVYSQSSVLQKEVFLVDRIDRERNEKLLHLKAVYFLRPTQDNFKRLVEELKNPNFHEYYLFFSSFVPQDQLQRLAEADETDSIRQVQEFYADYYAVNKDLFTLNIPSTINLLTPEWHKLGRSVFDRMVEGVIGCLLSVRKKPVIRFARSSELCRQLADEVQSRMDEEPSLFEFRRTEVSPVLLIVDRRDDPVTPLLNQWTYQAMVHELIGISNNVVDMRPKRTQAAGAAPVKPELEQLVMSQEQDRFFADNMFGNFGDLAVAIKEYVDLYQQQTNSNTKIQSIEDMQNFIESYPEFAKLSGNVSKHVAVLHELGRQVETRNLLDVSKLEQEIACTDARAEHFREVMSRLHSPTITNIDRLRLVLLYALRYENDDKITSLTEVLRQHGIEENQIKLVDAVVQYAGSHVRGGDLFGNKNFFSAFQGKVRSTLKGVPNVYTQHHPLLSSTLDLLIKGKLRETEYPSTTSADFRARTNEIIVFMIGGVTYEEALHVQQMNNNPQIPVRIILGGSTIHNSMSFLAEVSQLVIRDGGRSLSDAGTGKFGRTVNLGYA